MVLYIVYNLLASQTFQAMAHGGFWVFLRPRDKCDSFGRPFTPCEQQMAHLLLEYIHLWFCHCWFSDPKGRVWSVEFPQREKPRLASFRRAAGSHSHRESSQGRLPMFLVVVSFISWAQHLIPEIQMREGGG